MFLPSYKCFNLWACFTSAALWDLSRWMAQRGSHFRGDGVRFWQRWRPGWNGRLRGICHGRATGALLSRPCRRPRRCCNQVAGLGSPSWTGRADSFSQAGYLWWGTFCWVAAAFFYEKYNLLSRVMFTPYAGWYKQRSYPKLRSCASHLKPFYRGLLWVGITLQIGVSIRRQRLRRM